MKFFNFASYKKKTPASSEMIFKVVSDDINYYLHTIYDRLVQYFEMKQPYLNPNLDEEEVAKNIGSNKVYVAKAIKLKAGSSFPNFMNRYRIEMSKALMREKPFLKIYEVATRCGYNSQSSFSLNFKKFEHMSPGAWKQINCFRYLK